MSLPDQSNLHAIEAGTHGPWVVLLHGFGGIADVWQSIIDRLAPQARVIAYDLPGHGRSALPADGSPVKAAVQAIRADLNRRGIDRFHLCGHSMGGAISTLVALAAPERITTLTLLAPGGMGAEINAAQLHAYARAATPSELRDALAPMSGPAARMDEAAIAALAQSRTSQRQLDTLSAIAEAITRGGRQGVIPAEQLAGLAMPVTVLWGTRDTTLPHGQTANLPANFTVVSLDGVGHMLIEEASEAVVEVLQGAIGRG